MIPRYDEAAEAAMRLLLEHNITETPIVPLPILKNWPGVRVISFARMANEANLERDELIPLFVANQDAATFKLGTSIDDVEYVVVYNARLPYEIIWRGLARELGHIVLGHDGKTRTAQMRRAEAMCFAHHLLSPRPILRMLQESGIPLTMSVLADTTGCTDQCLWDMQETPGVRVPPELNRQVRKLFEHGISEYIRYRSKFHTKDRSPLVDFGLYMDNYEE